MLAPMEFAHQSMTSAENGIRQPAFAQHATMDQELSMEHVSNKLDHLLLEILCAHSGHKKFVKSVLPDHTSTTKESVLLLLITVKLGINLLDNASHVILDMI